jgi:sulfide:quinone oxidoreductase
VRLRVFPDAMRGPFRSRASVPRRTVGDMLDDSPHAPLRDDERAEVVIAGGGVAALEAMIALSDLAPNRVHVTLVAPGPDFVYRPLKISESFGLGPRVHHPLARAARDFGASYVAAAVESVDPAAHEVRCSGGAVLPYDSLLVALGARGVPAFEHAETIGDDAADETLHGILADLEEGYVKRVAFVAPSSTLWSLPLYELALLTARDAWSMGIDDAQLVVVSAEDRPLGLFGPAAGASVERLLLARSIEFIGGSHADVRHGEIVLTPGGRRLSVQRTFALPVMRGPTLAGLPSDGQGFIPVDRHGRVEGVDGVFAAGDVTTFPLKQGGIAAQQAEAAAESVAARHGCAIDPEPFRPVLRGRLITGDDDLFLRHDVAGGAGEGAAAPRALWWPPTKIAAQRLAPYLFGVEEAERMGLARVTALAVD